ncbi:MAG: CRISPR-associated protein Csn1 [Ignavibacteriales bacterium CG18_big_fil_WC_8_21_14_2_50_31_20]|nr:MAG: CRISPR-associated protein Csn1 [Ignavibacteriales bacterium CG18_big_fil_WC_8_21_14_2_50_31_20]
MKKILGLDLGTNSIGWSLIDSNFEEKEGSILGLGGRIIPISQDILGKFDAGLSISQTAERTKFRGMRRLYQRDNLRRDRLHRVLNILGFLPKHYSETIDFEKHFGQFKKGKEVKLNYFKNGNDKYEFIFKESFYEMVEEFKKVNPELFYENKNGELTKLPFDWTIYYLRKKALSKKITKEELAWILLNFNQKRGYYQLRGEEEENSKDKDKEFVILKVKEVKDSGETIKKSGEILYDVYFENDWKYDRQIVKTENWIEKTKEFIVTSTIKKDGDIKRTFKEVDSEKDWPAIKAKTEKDIYSSGKTVGQYIFESLLENPKQKVRGKLIATIERKFYKEEIIKILKEQIKQHYELQDTNLYKKCVEELYPNNEGHKNNISSKDFEYLFIDDIIFYQRPLKSKKSTIGNCTYEIREYCKNGETILKPLKGIPKSHPLFQEFRLLQWLHNLRIYQNEKVVDGKTKINVDITNDILSSIPEKNEFLNFLKTKGEIEQKHILKYFNLDASNYRWNYQEDKKFPCYETRAEFIRRLKKVDGIDNPLNFLMSKTKIGNSENPMELSIEAQLWHIIYSVKDRELYKKALTTFAEKFNIQIDTFVSAFEKHPPFKNDYGSYSEKALKKLLPIMRFGKDWRENDITSEIKELVTKIQQKLENINYNKELFKEDKNNILSKQIDNETPKQLLKSFVDFKDKNHLENLNTYQACYAVYKRHSEVGEIKYWKTSKDIDKYLIEFKQHSLRNPIVEQVVTETLRVVRDIWNYYGNGEEGFFDEIHIELGREMKNPSDKRKKISEFNLENERTNSRIRTLLTELINDGAKPYSPSHQEILKIYEEGVYQNPEANFNHVSEEDILKIRKQKSPTKSDIQKYKLWLEQGYRSPYSGKIISLSKLFSLGYEVEHIIPQSRYFDDSLNNKVICETCINKNKDRKTAYEYIKEMGGSIVDGITLFNLEQYVAHCKKYFNKNTPKLNNLLSEDIPEGFINRQLNDTRYISKFVKGLLSNIVRTENEQEVTSKNLISVTGAITSKLKQDWGLNEKWNEIIQPRFERMNELTNSNDFGNWDYQKDEKGNNIGKRFFRLQTPDEDLGKLNKKRIDHRHHSLDALIIACINRKHIQYLNSLNNENIKRELQLGLLKRNSNGYFTKQFIEPWGGFISEAKNNLENIIVSFKQNTRVINKTNNKTWQWVEENGQLKKKLVKQEIGDNWAIRKPLHKQTIYGKLNWSAPNGKVITANRVPLSEIKSAKHLEKITDSGIKKILINHLKNYLDDKGNENYELAFNYDGIEELNKNIIQLNFNKFHQPIFKVRLYEEGKKFSVGETGNNESKFVEAEKGTNLFFAIYWNKEKQKREFETIPLNEVIDHQKWRATLPKEERNNTSIIPIRNNRDFLFSLSPNDLVYIPSEEEIENPHNVDFDDLNKEQITRIYKMISSSGNQCFFVKNVVAKSIKDKFEFSSLNKMEKSIDGKMIKEFCWKIEVDRLGKIIRHWNHHD